MRQSAPVSAQTALQGVEQDVAGEGGFAGAGDAGDDGEALEWYPGAGILQVVQVGAMQFEGWGVAVDGAAGVVGQGRGDGPDSGR